MFGTLITILPLLLGSTLAPVVLGLAIFLLATKNHPLKKAFAYLLGDVLVAIIYGIVGLLIGSGILELHHISHQSARIIDMVIGAIFIILAVLVGFRKKQEEKEIAHKEKEKLGLIKWFSVGFIVNFTNFDAVALYIIADKEINQSAILTEEKIILFVIAALFFLLPVLLPLILYLVAPKVSQKILKPVYSFSLKYGKYITMTIFIIFGIYLIFR